MVFRSSKKESKEREESHVIPTASAVEGQAAGSFIGKTMTIDADIVSDEDVTVEGKVTGNIRVGKTLTIGKSGSVKADIEAAVVRIFGEAKGNIAASQKVEILAQGRYSGDIQSRKLVVQDGAILNGNVNEEKGK